MYGLRIRDNIHADGANEQLKVLDEKETSELKKLDSSNKSISSKVYNYCLIKLKYINLRNEAKKNNYYN